MFEKHFRILLLIGVVALAMGAAFGQLAAEESTTVSEDEVSQDTIEPSIPTEPAPPTEAPLPTATPTEVVVESPPDEVPTPIPSPTPTATETQPDPESVIDPDPADTPDEPTPMPEPSPTMEPSPTPTVVAPTVKIVGVDFSPIDPAESSAITTGIITVAYADAPATEDWAIELTFDDFTALGNADAVSATRLTLLGITGADVAHVDLDNGVLTLSFAAADVPPLQGTLLITVQLSIPEPFGATSYRSQLRVSIAPDESR